ncbi:hypothetical protein [Mesomycoplasma dispar]|uniref:Uncharacterized protein n=1 Tax=Mesomycoplasma dispar TaxID=86660 RepID=A0ABN5DRU1_9BACT|nr:hypothetical protein [Mesomycoplasma dispar]ATP59724.1 hypothetical protein CSW10_02135 [Mesomycoplasma dispar]
MNKIKKTKILDAWTALEILTSGKFDKNGKLKPVNLKKEFDELVKQGEIKDDDFYTFLKKLFPKYKENNTICLFFGIFRLNEINIFKNDEIKSKFEKQFQFSIIAKINHKIEFTKNDFFIPEVYYLKLNNNEFLPNNKEKKL